MNAGGKVKLKGKNIPGYDSEIEVDIGSDNVSKYDVVSKEIPAPTPYEGGTITWFNAYGVKDKKTGKYASISYTVTLSSLPTGKRLFVLLPTGIEEIYPKVSGSGKVKFTLAIGDPPMGYGP
jgi:hypothetical protein